MKKLVTYSFMIFFAIGLNINSICYYINYFSSSKIEFSHNVCDEEKNEKEEKKSEEENEASDFLDKLIHTNSVIKTKNNQPIFSFKEINNFYFSGYYKSIYSPPEII